MAIQKQVMHLKARKGLSEGQSREHQRKWGESAWNEALRRGNFDRAREHLNFQIVDGKVQPIDKSKTIAQLLADNLTRRGIKDPNEGLDEPKFRTIGDFVFSGTHERMTEIAFGDQPVVIEKGNNVANLNVKRSPDAEQWAMDVYNFVAGKFGKENIVSFYVHLDETTMHAHVAVVPVTENGKISFKQVFAGDNKIEFKERMRVLHDELYNAVSCKWGLARGSSLTNEDSRHYQPEEFRRRLEDDSREKELALAEMDDQLSAARQELKMAETRVKGLRTMIDNLTSKKALLEKDIQELQRKIRNGEGDREQLEKQIDSKTLAIAEAELALAEKKMKLDKAEAALLAARKDMAEVSAVKGRDAAFCGQHVERCLHGPVVFTCATPSSTGHL